MHACMHVCMYVYTRCGPLPADPHQNADEAPPSSPAAQLRAVGSVRGSCFVPRSAAPRCALSEEGEGGRREARGRGGSRGREGGREEGGRAREDGRRERR